MHAAKTTLPSSSVKADKSPEKAKGYQKLRSAQMETNYLWHTLATGVRANTTAGPNSKPPPIQTKLTVGASDDKYEREADHVADTVMRMPMPSGAGEQLRTKRKHPQATSFGAPATASSSPIAAGGESLSAGARGYFEPRFGTAFNHIRVHRDTHASNTARELNARAFTLRNHIFFASGQYAPDTGKGRHLLAHELTHTIQQSGSGKTPKIQRFAGEEHQALGNEASGNADVDLGGADLSVSFVLKQGDVTALHADYFGLEELTDLAAIPGANGQRAVSRDEIIWALHEINFRDPRFSAGGRWGGYTFSDEVKDAVSERYKNRAASNATHFVAPRGRESTGRIINTKPQKARAGTSYRSMHQAAILMAYRHGLGSTGPSRAMAVEAAAQHYLTDAFASGHLRTPITLIREFWGNKYPLFWYNLRHKLALDTAVKMNEQDTNLTTIVGSVKRMYEAISATVEAMASTLPAITLGDLLAKIFHDVDNDKGLAINSGGRLYGDDRLNSPDSNNVTRGLAIAALRAGNTDISVAHGIGLSSQILLDDDLFDAVRLATGAPPGEFVPETHIPVPSASNPPQNWSAPSFEELWGRYALGSTGPTVGSYVAASLVPGQEMHDQLIDLGNEFPVVERRWSGNLHPRRAYREGFVQPLASNPRAGILSTIHWAPTYGLYEGRWGSHRDDVALDTGSELKDRGQLPGMTTPARVAYIRELIGGSVAGDEQNLVVDLFRTASLRERPLIYQMVEKHAWTGDWIHGRRTRDDDLWKALNWWYLTIAKGLINAGIPDYRRRLLHDANAPGPAAPATTTKVGSPGNLLHEGQVVGGNVMVRTGGVFNAGRVLSDGFSVEYSGALTERSRWLQFIWREIEVHHPTRRVYRLNDRIRTSGGEYGLTTNSARPNYNTDSAAANTPFYEGSFLANRTAEATTIFDLPSSVDRLVQRELTRGATQVISRAHFNTYLIQGMNTLYRVSVDVEWDYTSTAIPARTQSLSSAGSVANLDPRMRIRLVSQYPSFAYIQ